MNLFDLEIVTPEGVAYRDKVYQLLVRGVEGEVSILASHIPYVTETVKGRCRIYKENTKEYVSATNSGGMLYVKKDKVIIMTPEFSLNKE